MSEQEASAEIRAETPPEPQPEPQPEPPTPEPTPEPAPEPGPDEVLQSGEVALPGEGKVRLVRPEPYQDEDTKDRKDRVELA